MDVDLETYGYRGDDEFVNDDQFSEGFVDDMFDEGFV